MKSNHELDTHEAEKGPRALRVGLVGVGQRAYIANHVASADENATLVAAADSTAEGRARVAGEFGTEVEVFDSHTALIAGAALDAVIITTPDWTHAEIAIDFLRAGVAVYLEKPLAITIEDADEVLRVAYETGTKLYVGHNLRHAAVVTLMHDIIARGEIGEVKTVWVRHFVGNGGDYYFKDWHADRAKTNTLLLQKASHDIDVVHLLAGAYTTRVVGMGDLVVYGDVTDRDTHEGETVNDWFSYDSWPPLTQTRLNPVIDVEDVSMMMMTLSNGVLASYEQCHFTPDYWRNYTVIGTEGRLENVGDTAGGVVKVWNRRHEAEWKTAGDVEYPIEGAATGHLDADVLTMHEFLAFVGRDEPVTLSPVAARAAVAAGSLAARSLRSGSQPFDVPRLSSELLEHFASTTTTPAPATATAPAL